MKHIKSINEGWLDKIVSIHQPLWKQMLKISEEVFPKYLLSSKVLNKYIDSIEVEMFDNEDNETKECWVNIFTNIPFEYTTINKTFRIYHKNRVVFCTNGSDFHMNYPINSEEDLSEIIELFAMKMKPYLEDKLLEESGMK